MTRLVTQVCAEHVVGELHSLGDIPEWELGLVCRTQRITLRVPRVRCARTGRAVRL